VVYVDHDPVVLAHARDMLHNVPNTAIIDQDLLKPGEMLADPLLRSLIDFGEPTAFLFLSILHFVSDENDPAGLIARLLARFPAGSHVAISHATPDEVPQVHDVGRARPDLAAAVAAAVAAGPPAMRCPSTSPTRTTAS
jgi:S-adenosyl methyltransferase